MISQIMLIHLVMVEQVITLEHFYISNPSILCIFSYCLLSKVMSYLNLCFRVKVPGFN